MRRRDFVLRLPVLGSGLALGASTLSLAACGGVRYVTPRTESGRLVVPLADVQAAGALFVKSPAMARPVYLGRLPGGELVAVLASCTHAGCQPEPAGDRLVCPCHGSEFSFDGRVLQGPAERPLARYPVSIEGAEVVVRLEGDA